MNNKRLRYLSAAFAGIVSVGTAQAAWIQIDPPDIPIPTDFGGVSVDI